MTKMTGLDAFYNESEDKIWFGNLISELARLNNENERMIAAAILSNYRLSKTKPDTGFAPIFPDTCYHLTHYWPAAVDIPVASDNPVHYADAIRYNARTPLQGSLLPLTRLV